MTDDCINSLISLEPVFDQGAKLALDFQGKARSRQKLNTGVAEVDIVTEADLAVQEFVLSEIAKTPLVHCKLFAEEATPLVSKFDGTNGYILALDPIDGTALYAASSPIFSTIITLFHGGEVVYTYFNFPAFHWSRRMTRGEIRDFGTPPEVSLLPNIDGSRTIAYTYGNPEETIPEICQKLASKGYIFRQRKEISSSAGSTLLFYEKKVAGFYLDHAGVYDAFGAYHFAKIKGLKLLSGVDLAHFIEGPRGFYCPGWYLAMWDDNR